ncbi:hypothetical protein [Amycolatopsis sp. NPDC050768]|uniref:hypothetical protein n=1 Tax=Amycolatopsis sp. NPDC050768 TaxID=3154839 RepID=UPI0033E63AD7
MATDALHRALTEPGDPPLRVLPPEAARLLTSLAAPARLAAHLRAVHDVAWDLTAWLLRSYPTVAFDRPAVLFGAATHDIGKIAHPGELSGPGSDYEAAGYELLLAQGIDERLARVRADSRLLGSARHQARRPAGQPGRQDLESETGPGLGAARRRPSRRCHR